MKYHNAIFCSLLVSAVFSAGALWAMPDTAASGRISLLSGTVTVGRPTTPGQPVHAKTGFAVAEGDTIKVGPASRCEITFSGNYVVRLDQKTTLLVELAKLAGSKTRLSDGKVWLNVKKMARSQGFTIASPTAVAGIRGTIFSVDGDANAVKFAVYRGAIAVHPADTAGLGRDTGFAVEKGEELTLAKDFEKYLEQQKRSFEEFRQNEQEDFERFRNEQQQGADSLLNQQQEFTDARMEQLRNSFKPLGTYHVSLRAIDTSAESDWELWNKKRDRTVEW